MGKWIEACREFIETAKKRLSRMEAQEGEARLKDLEAEAVSVLEPTTPVQIAATNRQSGERDLMRCGWRWTAGS